MNYMKPGRAYHYQNTMALLNLLGFSGVKAGYFGFAKFDLLSNHYEVIRYENEVCIGLLFPTDTWYEIYGYSMATEFILSKYPKLQGFFSEKEELYKLRMWLPCSDSGQFGAALRFGIDSLETIGKELREKMLDYVFESVEPFFEGAFDFDE